MKRIIVLCLSLLCLSSLAQAVSVGDDKSVSILCNNSSTLQKSIKNKSATTSKRKSKKKKSKKNRVKTKRPMHKKKKHSKKLKKATSKKNSKGKKQSSKIRLNVNPKNMSQAIRNSELFAAKTQAALRKKFGSNGYSTEDNSYSYYEHKPKSIEEKVGDHLSDLYLGVSPESGRAAERIGVRLWKLGYNNFTRPQFRAACSLARLGNADFSREQLDLATDVWTLLISQGDYDRDNETLFMAVRRLKILGKHNFSLAEKKVADHLIYIGYTDFTVEQLNKAIILSSVDSYLLHNPASFEASSRLVDLSGDKTLSAEDFRVASLVHKGVGNNFSLDDIETFQLMDDSSCYNYCNPTGIAAFKRLRAIGKTQVKPYELSIAMDLISFNHAEFSQELFELAMFIRCLNSGQVRFSEKILNLAVIIKGCGFDEFSSNSIKAVDLLKSAQYLESLGIELSRNHLHAARNLYNSLNNYKDFSTKQLDENLKIMSMAGHECSDDEFAVGRKLIEFGYEAFNAEQIAIGMIAKRESSVGQLSTIDLAAFSRLKHLRHDIVKVEYYFIAAARRLVEIGLLEFTKQDLNLAACFVRANIHAFSANNLNEMKEKIDKPIESYSRSDLDSIIMKIHLNIT